MGLEDNRGIGWIITGVVLQWIGMIILLFITLPALNTAGDLGGFLIFLLIFGFAEVSLCTYGAVKLNNGAKGWIIFFLVYSIFGTILAIARSTLPIGPVFYLIGSIILYNHNKS